MNKFSRRVIGVNIMKRINTTDSVFKYLSKEESILVQLGGTYIIKTCQYGSMNASSFVQLLKSNFSPSLKWSFQTGVFCLSILVGFYTSIGN